VKKGQAAVLFKRECPMLHASYLRVETDCAVAVAEEGIEVAAHLLKVKLAELAQNWSYRQS
jgi:hypothetical protein